MSSVYATARRQHVACMHDVHGGSILYCTARHIPHWTRGHCAVAGSVVVVYDVCTVINMKRLVHNVLHVHQPIHLLLAPSVIQISVARQCMSRRRLAIIKIEIAKLKLLVRPIGRKRVHAL